MHSIKSVSTSDLSVIWNNERPCPYEKRPFWNHHSNTLLWLLYVEQRYVSWILLMLCQHRLTWWLRNANFPFYGLTWKVPLVQQFLDLVMCGRGRKQGQGSPGTSLFSFSTCQVTHVLLQDRRSWGPGAWLRRPGRQRGAVLIVIAQRIPNDDIWIGGDYLWVRSNCNRYSELQLVPID